MIYFGHLQIDVSKTYDIQKNLIKSRMIFVSKDFYKQDLVNPWITIHVCKSPKVNFFLPM